MARIAVIVSVVLASSAVVFAQQSQPAPGGRQGRGPSVPTNLGGAMRDMGQVMRRLSTEATDATKKDAALTDAILFERDVAVAKTGMPDNVRSLSGDAQAKALGEYRADMSKLLRDVLSLEDAIGGEKADDIKAALGQIGADEKAGHAQFRPE